MRARCRPARRLCLAGAHARIARAVSRAARRRPLRLQDKGAGSEAASAGAGRPAARPFTSGLLLGLGETRADTIEALLRVRHSHERWGGHVQEFIVQPFRPKEETRMAASEAFPEEELLWPSQRPSSSSARVASIQTPPNLSMDDDETLGRLLACGVDDWGVSPA